MVRAEIIGGGGGPDFHPPPPNWTFQIVGDPHQIEGGKKFTIHSSFSASYFEILGLS